MVEAASAKKQHRCSKEHRPADHASKRCREANEHNSRSQYERSHPSVQPAAESRLDCGQQVGQRSLGIALKPGLGGSVFFPKVNGGQGYSFRGRGPKFTTAKVTGR